MFPLMLCHFELQNVYADPLEWMLIIILNIINTTPVVIIYICSLILRDDA
jgi:hypothetical protein